MSKGARLREQRRVQTRRPGVPRARRVRYAAVGAVALALAAGLIGLSQVSAGERRTTPPAAEGRGHSTAGLFAGIPQDGVALGRPDAPVTLVEFADFQCPYCAAFARDALPELVRTYVRTGKVRIEYRALAFIGPDSRTARDLTLAAGRQGRFWDLAHRLFEHQGPENSGWASERPLEAIVATVPGLDLERALDDRAGDAVADEIERAERQAASFGISSTPSFLAGPTGGPLERVEIDSLEAEALAPTLDRLLAG